MLRNYKKDVRKRLIFIFLLTYVNKTSLMMLFLSQFFCKFQYFFITLHTITIFGQQILK